MIGPDILMHGIEKRYNKERAKNRYFFTETEFQHPDHKLQITGINITMN